MLKMKADIYNNKLYINRNNRFTLFLPFYSSLLNKKTVYQVKVYFSLIFKMGLRETQILLKTTVSKQNNRFQKSLQVICSTVKI